MRYVRGSQNVVPESEFPSEQLAQYRRSEAPLGPQGQRRVGEGRTATKGESLYAEACETASVDPEAASLWFEGIGLTFAAEPPAAVSPD